jgi:hypothetical protein
MRKYIYQICEVYEMMLAEIAQNYEWTCSDAYDLDY